MDLLKIVKLLVNILLIVPNVAIGILWLLWMFIRLLACILLFLSLIILGLASFGLIYLLIPEFDRSMTRTFWRMIESIEKEWRDPSTTFLKWE